MARTPEQIAADNNLTSAIEQVIGAYYGTDNPYLLTEYMVVTSQQRFDDEGEGITAVGIVYRDGDVPLYRAYGLIQYAAARMRKLITEDSDE